MERKTNQDFTSPVRMYVAQQLQTSFAFGQKYGEKTVKTFEMPSAKYEVRIMECYLTKKEAGEKSNLDLSRPLKPNSGLFFSSSWFEVHKINGRELDDLVEENIFLYGGSSEETTHFLLELDDKHKHFSYSRSDRFDQPEIFDDSAYKSRSLNQDERNLLDHLIKLKLDALYRR
ncbi:MAG: hypothetical protein AABY40_01495 [Nanoarchaeota archaeon]